jgi:hypothetical protein
MPGQTESLERSPALGGSIGRFLRAAARLSEPLRSSLRTGRSSPGESERPLSILELLLGHLAFREAGIKDRLCIRLVTLRRTPSRVAANTAGWILLVVGIVVLLIGVAIFVTGSRRSSTTVENVQSTPTGQERVEERRDWGSS